MERPDAGSDQFDDDDVPPEDGTTETEVIVTCPHCGEANELALDPATAGFHVVVSGHSHKPGRTDRAGVIYINPGSAGPRRFKLPISVARLYVDVTPWKVEFVELPDER